MILLLSARKFSGSASAASRGDLNGLGDLLGGGRESRGGKRTPSSCSTEKGNLLFAKYRIFNPSGGMVPRGGFAPKSHLGTPVRGKLDDSCSRDEVIPGRETVDLQSGER